MALCTYISAKYPYTQAKERSIPAKEPYIPHKSAISKQKSPIIGVAGWSVCLIGVVPAKEPKCLQICPTNLQKCAVYQQESSERGLLLVSYIHQQKSAVSIYIYIYIYIYMYIYNTSKRARYTNYRAVEKSSSKLDYLLIGSVLVALELLGVLQCDVVCCSVWQCVAI